MKKYFIDTNFFYSLVSPHDSLHSKARVVFESLKGSEIITSVNVLAELVCSGDDVDFIGILEMFGVRTISVEYSDILAIERLIPHDVRRSLKAVDSLILVQAKINESILLTFDTKLAKVYNAL
jgi:predicted nucleic acid-binding protein